VFPRDMVCLRNINVDTLHKGDTEDDDDDDNDNNNNNNTYHRGYKDVTSNTEKKNIRTFVLPSLSKFEQYYGETNRKEMKFAFSIEKVLCA
jgi:hypothetical protein